MAGYSGTPLSKKLGIKAGQKVRFFHEPDHFQGLLEPLPGGVEQSTGAEVLDLAILFTAWETQLRAEFGPIAARIGPAGSLWIGWPKRASLAPTDLTEDRVRAIGLEAGLVDVKVCAIDETWSGLKFVLRLADRKR